MQELFHSLDLDGDGVISRAELSNAAQRLGWHWPQAPLYAVLDLLTVVGPLNEQDFCSSLLQISADPWGPFGEVLLKTHALLLNHKKSIHHNADLQPDSLLEMPSLLTKVLGAQTGENYHNLLQSLKNPQPQIKLADAALLIIDPQYSFTSGVWMHSIGLQGPFEVQGIRRAFSACACLLQKYYHCLEVMFSRCPFPPQSYVWDSSLQPILCPQQPYFIKPGNDILWPPTNGFSQWMASLGEKKILIMGGCTLNSCVRVSASQVQQHFEREGIQVIVDLNLCGARMRNFVPDSQYGGISSVESAIHEMLNAGVWVVERVKWEESE